MRTKLISIGNSRGVRLPKGLIEQCGLGGEIDLEAKGDCLILRPVRAVRGGWEAAFERMRTRGDDQLLDAHALPPTKFDEEEWTW